MPPISPMTFAKRCMWLLSAVLLAQLVHLNFIASATIENNLTWLCVALSSFGVVALILRNIHSATEWPKIHTSGFFVLFIISFFSVVLFSRVPYILSFLKYGIYFTRENTEVGNGGWYSALTVMFYPLCIVLAFVNIPRRQYYIYAAMMWCVISLDFLILGTRNAPIFVLLFHLLTSRLKFTSLKMILIVTISIVLLVLLFDWQSKARSLDTVTVGWSWAETLRYSWLMDHLRVPEEKIRAIDENFSLMMPAVFLLQYISHSIAVFSDLISTGQYDAFGCLVYLFDQYSIVGGGRASSAELIQAINRDSGLYQTLYSSLLIDFGWVGVFLIAVILVLIYGFVGVSCATISPYSIYFLVVLSVSSVENYFYNGLTLWRFAVFLLLVSLLSRIPMGLSRRVVG